MYVHHIGNKTKPTKKTYTHTHTDCALNTLKTDRLVQLSRHTKLLNVFRCGITVFPRSSSFVGIWRFYCFSQQNCMGVEYCAKRPVCRSFEWINKLFPNVFIVNSCRELMIVATLTLLNFSPSWCGRSDRKLWKPALMLCIRRRSLLFAISRLIRFSFSMAVVWPPPPSSSSLCKLHIQKRSKKREEKKWIEWMNEHYYDLLFRMSLGTQVHK